MATRRRRWIEYQGNYALRVDQFLRFVFIGIPFLVFEFTNLIGAILQCGVPIWIHDPSFQGVVMKPAVFKQHVIAKDHLADMSHTMERIAAKVPRLQPSKPAEMLLPGVAR
jgi:hypothetical protein